MTRLILILVVLKIFFTVFHVHADTVKVAVIDTGFSFNNSWGDDTPKLCNSGHIDFTNTSVLDDVGHGTHIAGLISKNAGNSSFCLLIIKFFSPRIDSLKGEINSLKYAINAKVNIINLSLGGYNKSYEECSLIKKALDKGIIVVAAAGNDHQDINKQKYYPAMCDNRVIVVQNYNNGKLSETSNYGIGKNFVKENGTNIFSTLPNNQYGYMSGTSQATAIVTGKLIKQLNKKEK